MYVERTNYFAKPGRAEEMLAARRKASRVRVSLGLPAGTILTKQAPGGDGADVAWECRFATLDDQRADLAARAASPDFEAVRREVGGLVERFERHLFRTDASEAGEASDASDAGGGAAALEGRPIVPRRVSVPAGDRTLAGYLYLPPGDGRFPCMVTNHGSTIHRGSADLCRPGSAALLMSWGIASLLVHRHGYGESPGPAWQDDVPAAFGSDDYDTQLVGRLDRESDDVLAALGFAESLPDIDPARIGVMGSSFGGTVTLLAAAKTDRWRCAVEFAGAAMNWERTPKLRQAMVDAARRGTSPIFFVQAENDYSVAPTRELAASLEGLRRVVQSKIFPAFGISQDEGHFFERSGSLIWGNDVRCFLQRWL